MDDGSTDSSGKCCDDYAEKDHRCIAIHHQHNLGLWAARNTGMDAADGAFITFIDSDDYSHVDTVRQMHDALAANPGCDLAIVGLKQTATYEENLDGGIEAPSRVMNQKTLMANLFDVKHFYMIPMWNKLYRRELIGNIRCQEYYRSQDFDFNFRVFLKAEKAVFIDSTPYYWVQRPGSLTHRPETWPIFYESRSRMSFENYRHLPRDKKEYSSLLLESLYNTLSAWVLSTRTEHDRRSVSKRSRPYIKKTALNYLLCGKLSWKNRLYNLSVICFPRQSISLLSLIHSHKKR